MGIGGIDAFAVYSKRYEDFPEPTVARGRYCKLYLRQDIEAFMKRHPKIGRKRSAADRPDDVTPPS
jgi:hypothetical protein